eukprot:TRINITY_DN10960_c0_g1_i1.p1 TRINITY_DN10960_c0_g1~~TRINITY_DN10960_c0_g1_i1.p1  ORF type:complete len:140 (-),score=46.11 TRINITY_DN10960_c0_g1_i1:120-509(-)
MEQFLESLKDYKSLMLCFTSIKEDAELFMGVIEEFVCKRNPDALLGKVYKILECLYDEDIVSEDDILLWAERPTHQAMFVEKEDAETIREKATPFVQWLRDNDDSDSDDDDGDDDNDQDYLNNVVTTLK